MSYEVLARKWRPQTFNEVVGQDHITRTLKKAVELGRISHAYLFSGPRGCGKTSTARIVAKVINCTSLENGNPCNTCPSCVGVIQGKNLDVMEIDGASHTGVAEVRDLQESIGYAPSQYRNKIYIIDEVHMLSINAFNALLKTLEEPPKHVYFIFATTAPHKIPETIKSRCQRHPFKRLEIGEITGQLEKICQAEKVEYEREALRLLARKAEGSMRDGESLLDQCITASSGRIVTAAVRDILGLLDVEMVLSFIGRIAERDPTEVLKQLDQSVSEGVDLQELAGALLEGFRDLMILAVPGELSELLFRSKDEIESFKVLVPGFELPDLVTIVERLCNVIPRLRSAGDPRILLESVLVDITLLDRQTDIRAVIEQLQSGSPPKGETEKAGSGSTSGFEAKRKRQGTSDNRKMESESPINDPVGTQSVGDGSARFGGENDWRFLSGSDEAVSPKQVPGDAAPRARKSSRNSDESAPQTDHTGKSLTDQNFQEQWNGFVNFVRQKKVSLGVCLVSAKLASFEGERICLEFPKGFLIQKEQVENPESIRFIKLMLKKYFGKEMDVSCNISGEKAVHQEQREVGGGGEGELRGRRAVEQQPIIKKIIEDFDGEIVRYHP